MQNAKFLIKTDELIAGPNAAKQLKLHFTTVPRLIIKGKVSFPIHGFDHLHINDVLALNLEISEGR